MKSFFASLRQLAAEIRFAMCKLNEIQFSAPGKQQQPRCG